MDKGEIRCQHILVSRLYFKTLFKLPLTAVEKATIIKKNLKCRVLDSLNTDIKKKIQIVLRKTKFANLHPVSIFYVIE